MSNEMPPPPLPTEAARLLRTVDVGEILGASRQLHVLGECLTALAQARGDDPPRLRAEVAGLEQHVRRTRGASSQAVTNGMALMAKPVLTTQRFAEAGDLGLQLTASVAVFRSELRGWQVSIREHAAALLSGCSTILAYDYSSTVSQAIVERARAGRKLRVIVPEARSLDGGRKYLADWHDLGIIVDLVPDSAIGWGIASCEIALAGAETLSVEGGCYNTVGTSIAAHEAGRRQVPFYVLSVLLKTDLSTSAAERPSPVLDFLELTHPSGRPKAPQHVALQGIFPDLDYTEPGAITGVVTERGSLDPADLAAAARAVLVDLEPARD